MYVYGKNVIRELLKNNKKIIEINLYDNFSDHDLIFDIQKKNIKINYKSKFELDKIEKGNHQGIIASIPDYHYCSLDELLNKNSAVSLLIILDHLEDPQNLGAIIRTCEAAGVDGIIIPKDRSVSITSAVMKVSAGALDNVPICSVTNLSNMIKEIKKRGFWIVGTDMDTNTDYTSVDYNIPIALIIGSEGKGMSRIVKESCDFIVSIPMIGEINSLNASVAAGIMIYEVLRQRRK
jgi:23S rRNA (guanosine2251-2'-O)-methyltransferase